MLRLLLVIASMVLGCHCEKGSGSKNMQKNNNGMVFVGKFCYQSTSSNTSYAGMVDMKLTYTGQHKNNWYFVMYDDQSDSWPSMYNDDSLTCEEKISRTYSHFKSNIGFTDDETTHEYSFPIKEKIRPRWWWAYIANCDLTTNDTFSNIVSDISYSFHFYQYGVTMWNKEAGINDRGLNTMYLFYLCFYILLFGTQLYSYYLYKSQQYVHQVIKLLTGVIFCQLFAVMFSFTDWMIYTETGKHELFFEIMSEIGYVAANTIFLLLLLVLGQGWTISRFEVVWPKTILLICIMSALTQCGIFIWILVGFDEETTKYYYDTLPEWIYASLFIVVGIGYIVECIFSIRSETLDSKKKLYIVLCAVFSLWFMFPIITLLIADVFDPWRRDICIDAFQTTISTLAFMVMMGFMWPSWAHQYFNLSMGDTQDRILSGGGGSSGFTQLNNNRL